MMLSVINDVNETLTARINANRSNLQQQHANESSNSSQDNLSMEYNSSSNINYLITSSRFRLKNKILLKDCLRSNKLKEILSKMDNLPCPILNDLFKLLNIDEYDDQKKYIEKAEQKKNFFIELLNEEYVKKRNSSIKTLNELIDKLGNLNQTPIIWDDITKSEEKILSELNKDVDAISLNLDHDNLENINVLLFYDHTANIDRNRIENLIQFARKHDIILRDVSRFKPNYYEGELRKNQPVFLLFDKNLERKLANMNANENLNKTSLIEFYQLIYIEYLEKKENIRYIPFLLDDLNDYKDSNGKIQFKYKWLLQKNPNNSTISNDQNKIVYNWPLKLPRNNNFDSKTEKFFKDFAHLNDSIIQKLNRFNQNK